MSSISSSFVRAPNLLASQQILGGLTRTGIELISLQNQLALNRRVTRPSDDPVAASVISVLDSRLEVYGQRERNIQHASATLSVLDQATAEAGDIAVQAQAIASEQVNTGSDAATRRNQAVVVQSLLDELTRIANTNYLDIHVFGGSTSSRPPIEQFLGGYRYVGQGDGLLTDLGEAVTTPITVGGDTAFGSLSTRVQGDVDLNPALTRNTLLTDVRGARQLGVTPGQIAIQIDDGVTPVTISVDLTGSETVGNVLDRIESAIRAQDPAALDGAYPSSGVAGERFSFDVAAGYTIRFADVGAATSAQDLGLVGFDFDDANAVSTNASQDLDPRVTESTLLGDLDPATPLVFGDILFRNGSQTGTVTTDPTMTVGQFKAQVAALNLGIRVGIGADGRTLDVVNEVSGIEMSVEEVGSTAATTLGIRTFKETTPLSVFNSGRGVEIADGATDPTTGLPDPARNLDFRVTLADGSTFDVDLTPADVQDVGSLLAKINADAAAAGFGAVFSAGLATNGNGIVFEDTTGGGGTVSVTTLNGFAAEDLGLIGGTFDPGPPATFAGADRAKVRVDSIFSTLIELRDALEADDRRGIQLAGERLAEDGDRLIRTRALVGVRAARVEAGLGRLEDAQLLDESIRSGLRDLDYTEAATRFSLLELQQQAALATAARANSLTLLDFLG